MSTYWTKYLDTGNHMGNIRLNFCLNDSADVLIRFKATPEHAAKMKQTMKNMNKFDTETDEEQKKKEDIINCSLFYYQAGDKNKYNADYIYYDGEDD